MNVNKVLNKVARENGVTYNELMDEIQIAIDHAIANPEISAQQNLKKIPKKGEKPTIEELISFLLDEIK